VLEVLPADEENEGVTKDPNEFDTTKTMMCPQAKSWFRRDSEPGGSRRRVTFPGDRRRGYIRLRNEAEPGWSGKVRRSARGW